MANVGEEVSVDVVIKNPKGREFDRVAIFLRYDPEALELSGVDDEPIASTLHPGYERIAEVVERGLYEYSARFGAAIRRNNQPLLTVRFKALKDSGGARIQFATTGEEKTVLKLNDKVVLGGGAAFDSGTLNARVIIRDKDAQAPILHDRLSAAVWGEEDGSDEQGLRRASMTLSMPEQSAPVGQTFNVHLLLDNPASRPITRVSAVLRFDPEMMEVVDFDEGNFIKQGINIFDGAYHAAFPFDMHLTNEVDNLIGRIGYSVGSTRPGSLATRGRIATIRFMSLKAGEFAPVWFEQAPNGVVSSEVVAEGESAEIEAFEFGALAPGEEH